MRTSIPSGAVWLLLALPFASFAEVSAQTAPAPPPPAPAPGAAGIFRSHADLEAAMARSIAAGGAMSSASVTLTDQYRAAMVRRTEPNGAIAHPGNTEMHYIVEGSGTVVTGGRVVRREGVPATIEGGEAHRVTKGDIIIIPAGSAHMYSEVVEPITYLEFRFVAPQ
ncbi:MAG: AraC family ligand binding domain-containing protein [Gemmatimonadales bacterium]